MTPEIWIKLYRNLKNKNFVWKDHIGNAGILSYLFFFLLLFFFCISVTEHWVDHTQFPAHHHYWSEQGLLLLIEWLIGILSTMSLTDILNYFWNSLSLKGTDNTIYRALQLLDNSFLHYTKNNFPISLPQCSQVFPVEPYKKNQFFPQLIAFQPYKVSYHEEVNFPFSMWNIFYFLIESSYDVGLRQFTT